MQRIIRFGSGSVSVAAGFESSSETRKVDRVVIEPGLGSGVVGGKSNRELNVEFDPSEDATILVFTNPESVRAVIGQLREVEMSLRQPDDQPTWNEMRITDLEAQVSILKDGIDLLLTAKGTAAAHAEKVLNALDEYNMNSNTGS